MDDLRRRRMLAAIVAGERGSWPLPPDTYTRGTLLPAARNNRTGEIGLAVPQAALDAWEAVKLPGDVLAGRVDPNSPQGFERIMGLAGLASGGGLATRAIPGSLGMGARRLPPYKRPPSSSQDYAREIAKVLETGKSSRGKLFRKDLGEITVDVGVSGNAKKNFKGGWGLSHIRDKRTAVDGVDGKRYVRETLPKVLSDGKLTSFAKKNEDRKAILETPDDLVMLRRYRYGKDPKAEDWVLSAYPKGDDVKPWSWLRFMPKKKKSPR